MLVSLQRIDRWVSWLDFFTDVYRAPITRCGHRNVVKALIRLTLSAMSDFQMSTI